MLLNLACCITTKSVQCSDRTFHWCKLLLWQTMNETRANKNRSTQRIFKSKQRYEYFLRYLVLHSLEKLMRCPSHSTVLVGILQRSAKVSRRSNRTLVESWPNRHCGYFCNGRFYVRLSFPHSCICTHNTSTEHQLLTTQVLSGQCSSNNSRYPCREN